MEFYNEVEKQGLDIARLKNDLQLSALPGLCHSIDSVVSDNHRVGEMHCIWGRHKVAREEIMLGVRFSLLDCPHALAWTIAYHEDRRDLVIHCTIDDREASEGFVESIQKFVWDWGFGLDKVFREST